MSVKGLLFIDANQYLYLYGTPSGGKLLSLLQEYREHILVTTQIVAEVDRCKVRLTASFLTDHLEKLERNRMAVPVHLLSTADKRVVNLQQHCQDAKKTAREFKELTHELLNQVSQSRDEVSKALADVFSQAVAPNEGELDRARKQKERGNPPGKQNSPLGDQVSWEQLLSRCKDKPQLWIISKDSDYGTVHERKMFLNAALYKELAQIYESEPTVHCFDSLSVGLNHFGKTIGVKQQKLLTREETEQIKKEQESLPPLGWLTSYDDSYPLAMRLQDASRMNDSLASRLSQVMSSDEAISPPATKEADKDGT